MRKFVTCFTAVILILSLCTSCVSGLVSEKLTRITETSAIDNSKAEAAAGTTTQVKTGEWNNASAILEGRSYSVLFNDAFRELWFKFEVTNLGKAIAFSISCDDPSVTGITTSLYYENDLNTYGNSAERRATNYSVNKSVTHKVEETGIYYVRISILGSSAVGKAMKFSYSMISGDAYENNDTWQEATAIRSGKDYNLNISASNDVDWFKIILSADNQSLNYILKNNAATNGKATVSIYKYSDLAIQTEDAKALHIYTSNTFNNQNSVKMDEADTYYIKITPPAAGSIINDLTLNVNTVNGDRNENNDNFTSATILQNNAQNTFTLSSSDDVDWFMVRTSGDDQTFQLLLSSTSSSSDKIAVWWYIYEELLAYGNNATPVFKSAGKGISYYYASDSDEYCVKVFTTNKDVILSNISIQYTLIEPDANEPNNSFMNAKDITYDNTTEFTLPALNDTDFFKIYVRKDFQTIRFNTDIEKTNADVDAAIYTSDEVLLFSSVSKGDPISYMLNEAGWYYICISSDTIIKDECLLTYSILSPDPNENNNEFTDAVELVQGVPAGFTISGTNDVDWFKVTTVSEDQVIKYKMSSEYNKFAKVEIFDGNELLKYWGDANPIMTSTVYDEEVTFKVNAVGDYYIKVTGTKAIYDTTTLLLTLGVSDDNENNDTWEKATVLQANETVEFTISAKNDVDWFRITSVNKNTMSYMFKTNGAGRNALIMYIYRESDLENYGSSAQYIYTSKTTDITNLVDIGNGNYYMKIVSANGAPVEVTCTLKANVFMMID
jgi:hypothetical protein